MVQNGHPIAFASRTLSNNEQKWAQIEKELLAVVFACQRFHFLLYGREFLVESDHKPLEALIKRDIDDVTARLQRMFMCLLKYPGMSLVYKPGKEMLVADCLSRAQLLEVEENAELACVIHTVTKSVCVNESNYEYCKKIIGKDEDFKKICTYIENGWPGYHHLNNLGQHFYKLKSELHFENGLIFYNHRLVIPQGLQRKIVQWVHDAHLGVEKTLARARKLYYWPGMGTQIKEVVQSCKICEKFTRNNRKEPLIQEEIPEYPYQVLAMDLFEYAGCDFIAMIDAYSNFLTAIPLNNKTTKSIVSAIQSHFNIVGYPTIIRCDNSPFGSAEFAEFALRYNIQIKFSSPRYPQSNGLAEKAVAIAKNILKRCYEMNDVGQFQYRVLEYNNTPVASLGVAPTEWFYGRLVKSKLPICKQLLLRKNCNENETQKIKMKKEKQKFYYDRMAKSLPRLNEGDLIMFKKDNKNWTYGTVIGNVNNRSYIVKDGFDNKFRRNRKFIVKTKNTDFNASELLSEEITNSELDNLLRENKKVNNNNDNSSCHNSENMSRGQELNILHTKNDDNNKNQHISSENGTSLMTAAENMSLSEDYTAVRDEPASESSGTPIIIKKTITTRSGRVIRAPKRYEE